MARGPYYMDQRGGHPGEAVEDAGHRDGDAAKGVIVLRLPDDTKYFARESGPDNGRTLGRRTERGEEGRERRWARGPGGVGQVWPLFLHRP
jgi:hypothetical protein